MLCRDCPLHRGHADHRGQETDTNRPETPLSLSPNLRGALFMAVSMAGFTVNDAIAKMVMTSMNMGQVMLVRGVFATVLVGLLAWK